jgi:uncharacterized membrane protein YoaK (UPF0700 family)
LISAILLTFAGGFCDAYTFIYREGVFATMQTGNLIKLFVNLTNGVFKLIYLLPIIIFLLGVIIAVLLEKSKYFSQITLIALLVSYVCAGFCPQKEAWDIVCVSILSLTGAMQFEAFRRCLEYRYTSTMCTNNMRLLAVSVAEKKFDKTLLYIAIIVVFSIGVISGALLGKVMGVYSISPIAAVYLMVLILQLVTKEVPNNEETAD